MAFCSPEAIKNPEFNYTKKISLPKYKCSKTLPTDYKIEKKKPRLNSVGSLSFLCRRMCWTAHFKE